MKLAFIAPTCALNEISSLGDIDFCLAQEILKDENYKSYYQEQIKNKRYVILDNGASEGEYVKGKELVDIAIEMKVSEIIIPDKIGNYKQTNKWREDFLKKYYNILKKNKIKIQGVIQGSNLGEYNRILTELQIDKRVDVIGIPFRICYAYFIGMTEDGNHMTNRFLFTNILEKLGNHKPIHLLGCNLPVEYVIMQIYKIRSCDSSLMARYGFNNKIFNFNDKEKPKKKLFINSKMEKEEIKMAVKNIQKLREMLVHDKPK